MWQFGHMLRRMAGANKSETFDYLNNFTRGFNLRTAKSYPQVFTEARLDVIQREGFLHAQQSPRVEFSHLSKQMNQVMTNCGNIFPFQRMTAVNAMTALREIKDDVPENEELSFSSVNHLIECYTKNGVAHFPEEALWLQALVGVLDVEGQDGSVFSGKMHEFPVFAYKSNQSPEIFLTSKEEIDQAKIVVAEEKNINMHTSRFIGYIQSSSTQEYLYVFESLTKEGVNIRPHIRSVAFGPDEIKEIKEIDSSE